MHIHTPLFLFFAGRSLPGQVTSGPQPRQVTSRSRAGHFQVTSGKVTSVHKSWGGVGGNYCIIWVGCVGGHCRSFLINQFQAASCHQPGPGTQAAMSLLLVPDQLKRDYRHQHYKGNQ